jgi:hypothetical protein
MQKPLNLAPFGPDRQPLRAKLRAKYMLQKKYIEAF